MSNWHKIAIAGVIIFLATSSAAQSVAVESTPEVSNSLETCLATRGKLRVLMLVDESQSLKELGKGTNKSPGNDPTDMRVPALTSVVRVLNSAVESSAASLQKGREPLEVAIAISGFGETYTNRLEFTLLSDRSIDQVVGVLEGQGDRDTDLRTRYDDALAESLKEFESDADQDSACRLLIWFSDGQHDSNNEPGYSNSEKEEVENSLCGTNGTVDGLRAAGVTIVAAGLNPDESELDLMRLIAAGGAGYKFRESSGRPGRVSVAVDRCGAIPADGKFALAQDADDIVDSLFEVLVSIPGIPDPENPLESPARGTEQSCATSFLGGEPCFTQSFVVDDSISAFQILVERPSESVSVLLTSAESQEVVVLNGGGPSASVKKNVIETTVVSAQKATISVTKKKENPIQGQWLLAFYGPDAEESRSSITFTGAIQVEIVDEDGEQVDQEQFRIGRFEATDLGVRLGWDRSTSPVEPSALSVGVTLRSAESEEAVRLNQTSSSPLTYEISATELETVLQSPALKRVSAVDVVIRPSAEVKGIRFASGDPVTIDFGEFPFKASISNGEGLPTFVALKSVAGIEFEGTPKKRVELQFRGPDSGDGFVTFRDFVEPEGIVNLSLVASKEPCQTPQQQIVTCFVDLIPDDEAVQRFTGQLLVEYSALDGVRASAEGLVDVPVATYLRPRVWVGWLAASTLLAMFVLVQGLVRLGLAIMLSKFSALSPTARRVRLRAKLDSNGSLSITAPAGDLPPGDDGFAFEIAESVPSFDLFGYRFECPYWHTFFKSTTVPLGMVSNSGVHVIGSQGYLFGKRGAPTAVGQVALSLRGQWVIGITQDAMTRLVGGGSEVDAELVAFLEPYEQPLGQPRTEQISGLSFAIASSNFSNHVASLLDSVRTASADQGDDLSASSAAGVETSSSGTGSASATDVFGGGAFGTAEAPVAAEDEGSARRKRGRRGSEQKPETIQQESTKKEQEWDPFA